MSPELAGASGLRSSAGSPSAARRRRLGGVTLPDDDRDPETTAGPLGAEVAPPGDPESQGGTDGPASGVAGPSYPPAATEPDAHAD